MPYDRKCIKKALFTVFIYTIYTFLSDYLNVAADLSPEIPLYLAALQ